MGWVNTLFALDYEIHRKKKILIKKKKKHINYQLTPRSVISALSIFQDKFSTSASN